MATSIANPQAAAPGPEQDQGGASGQQANPLQTILARIAITLRQIGQQNTVIQPEMQQASSILISALQKSSQAAPGAPQPLSAPPQG
jgi:hypothetical protein